jgi:RecG-like helicase
MITNLKIYETWNDSRIDKSLFVSGRAKHNPKVLGNTIEYKTDNGKYIAVIKQLGSGKFICKVYRLSEDGNKIRIRKKIKKTLQTAHNFTREFLNDKIDSKKKKSKKKKPKTKPKKNKDPLGKLFVDMDEPGFDDDIPFNPEPPTNKSKSIIRRFS